LVEDPLKKLEGFGRLLSMVAVDTDCSHFIDQWSTVGTDSSYFN